MCEIHIDVLEILVYLFDKKFGSSFSKCIYINIFKSFVNVLILDHFRISIYAQYFYEFIIYSNKYKYYRT